jgi:hypothetical protein
MSSRILQGDRDDVKSIRLCLPIYILRLNPASPTAMLRDSLVTSLFSCLRRDR